MGYQSDSPSPDGRMLNRTAHLWRATPVEHEPRGTAGSGVPEAIRLWLLGGSRKRRAWSSFSPWLLTTRCIASG